MLQSLRPHDGTKRLLIVSRQDYSIFSYVAAVTFVQCPLAL